MLRKTVRFVVGLGIAAAAPTALAQHTEGQEHGKPAEFKMPATYKDAVKEIEHRLHEIEELMDSKHLDDVHAQADVIKKIGEQIGQLALKPDSGVSKDAVKEINQTGKALAEKFDAIDKVADAGDAAGTKKVYDEMVKLGETLKKYLPKSYACPMKCEGDKTYNQPGKCPKCGMDLQEVKSAERGEHGGPLLTTADGKHKVEATLADQGEVRVYCYDEHSEPMPCDKFTATARVGKQGASEADAKSVALNVDPSKAYFAGKIDPSVRPPLNLKLAIDFKVSGQRPERLEFVLDGPTGAPVEKPLGEERHGGRGEDEHPGHRR